MHTGMNASPCGRDHPFCRSSRLLSFPKWWGHDKSRTLRFQQVDYNL